MKKLMIGIDLGTTYSCAAVLTDAGTVEMTSNKDTGSSTTPSVLLIEPKKKNLVGDSAKSLIASLVSINAKEAQKQRDEGFYLHTKNTKAVIEKAKRYIGTNKIYEISNEEYDPTFVSGAVLKKIKQDIEESYGQNIDSAVITVPANFNNQQRQETMDAAHMAGLQVDYIINEPTAAALAYSLSSQIDGIYAVYDFGGGTFDCSIVETKGEEVTILGSDGVKELGGKDLDRRLLEIIDKKYKKETKKDLSLKQYSMLDAEQDKLKLSTLDEVEIYIDGTTIIVTRSEFEAAISTLIQKSLLTFDNAVEDAKVSVDNIMDVVLVGGTSRVPLVQKELENKIGKKPKVYGNPDETVAKGAAIYVALKNKRSLNINQKAAIAGFAVKEITNVYLGTSILSRGEDGKVESTINDNIIMKGDRVPAKKTKTYYMPYENVLISMRASGSRIPLNMDITEGYTDETNLANVETVWKEAVYFDGVTVDQVQRFGDPEAFIKKYVPIKVQYSIDENQVFRIIVKHPYSGETIIEETISMKEGSLGAGSGNANDDLDDFTIE